MTKRPGATRNPELRIIGGQWRSRKLLFEPGEGLRPTGNRIREMLFNWLQHDVRGARVLDLFSGSGALGFEAASRGAGQVVLVDSSFATVEVLRRNCALLQSDQIEVVHAKAAAYLDTSAPPFDLLFLDPPFADDELDAICARLETRRFVNRGARIYIETPRGRPINTPESWKLLRNKSTGNVEVRLFQAGI